MRMTLLDMHHAIATSERFDAAGTQEHSLPAVIVPDKHFDVIAHFIPVEAEHKMLCGQPESSMKPHLSSRVDSP